VDNLVGNALKYTDPGGSVWVTLQTDGEWAQLAVTDTGIGIAEDELAMLGTRFFRGREAQGRAAAGTGLGLSIVQEIVAAHDGELSVDSTPGAGSTFTVRMPAVAVPDGTRLGVQFTDRPADT
jgi:two-component system sensor histidine kinase SenX3